MGERIRRIFRRAPSPEGDLTLEVSRFFQPFKGFKESEIDKKIKEISPREIFGRSQKIAGFPITIEDIKGEISLMAEVRSPEPPSTPLGEVTFETSLNTKVEKLQKCAISVSAAFVITPVDQEAFEQIQKHRIQFRIKGREYEIDFSEFHDRQAAIDQEVGHTGSAMITNKLREPESRDIVLFPSEKVKKIRHLEARIIKIT